MKKQFLGLGLLLLIFVACNDDYEEVYSNGNIVNKEITLENINGILLEQGNCKVNLRNGETQKITTKISDNIFQYINTTVTNGVWKIDFKDNDDVATYNEHLWEITIESPSISKITNESSGSITCLDTLYSSPLTVIHNSSGSISIVCDVQDLNSTHDGSGTFYLGGNAVNNSLLMDASGEYKAFDLNVDTYTLNQQGSGKTEISASTLIKGLMDGSGNVYYKGDPEIEVVIEGSGKLIQVN